MLYRFYRGSLRKLINTCRRHKLDSDVDAALPTSYSDIAGYVRKSYITALIHYEAAPCEVQHVKCLLTMSGNLLLAHAQIVGEGDSFTVSPRRGCVSAITVFNGDRVTRV